MADRFDKFTPGAWKVLWYAQQEAQQLHDNSIGTEHILLGLLRERNGVAAKVLKNAGNLGGLGLARVRYAVEYIYRKGAPAVFDVGLSLRAKTVIELAVTEARRLDHHEIGTGHLLLGLLSEGTGVAVDVLKYLGANPDLLWNQTLEALGAPGSPRPKRPAMSPQDQPDAPAPTSSHRPQAPTRGWKMEGWQREAARPTDSSRQGEATDSSVLPPDYRLGKFTERARKVLKLALDEAERFNHTYIGTEHLLLGLVREGEGLAARVLSNLGVKVNNVRLAVESIIGRGDPRFTGPVGLTPRAKKVIELSVDEARRINHHYIGTEHLLLGLVREGEGVATGVLESLGVSLEKVRRDVMDILKQSAAYFQLGIGVEISPAELSKIRKQLDDGAWRAFTLAQRDAIIHQHSYVGTEHLLLGLIAEREGIAATALAELTVTRERVDKLLESLPGEGDRKSTGWPALTTRVKRAIELAAKEAQNRNASAAGTEHLLLGLVAEVDGVAMRVLERLEASPEAVRAAIERRL